MVFKHSLLTFAADLKKFQNIVKSRQRIFDAASDAVPKNDGSVNALACQLHPDTVRLRLEERKTVSQGLWMLRLASADGEALPIFKAGQSTCIYAKTNGGLFLQPYPIAPCQNGEWSILLSSKCVSPVTDWLIAAEIGEIFEAAAPQGFMYFSPLRDTHEVLMLADETGIGAALSLEKENSCKLSVMLEGASEEALMLFEDYKSIGVSAFDASKISKNKTVFICGTGEFYDRTAPLALKTAGKQKYIRFCITDSDESASQEGNTYKCRVIKGFDCFDITCSSSETLLTAFEKAGIRTAARCKTGECGYCGCRLTKGEIKADFRPESDSRRQADIKHNVIHPCRSYPQSDIVVEL